MTSFSQFDPDILGNTPKRMQEFYAYWCKIRGDRIMPRRIDFDPMDIPHHLPGILLIDVVSRTDTGERSFRYRVVGQWEVLSRNANPTGLWVEEGAYPNAKERALANYKLVQDNKEPLFRKIKNVNIKGVPVEEMALFVPLSKDGTTVSQILVYSEQRAP